MVSTLAVLTPTLEDPRDHHRPYRRRHPPRPDGKPAAYSLSPQARRVFVGLMIGMFVAAISQTIVSPAMPIIVAELGGMAHYSWLATSAMLARAVVVPIVGKLSDLYGRRPFYIAGLIVFMVGSGSRGPHRTSGGSSAPGRCRVSAWAR